MEHTRRTVLAGAAHSAMMVGTILGNAPGEASVTDFARAAHVDSWLHHPVIGDPSWDAFVRDRGNPILRGETPYEWPVNGTLLHDPVSRRWFAFVSVYPRGYWPPPAANTRVLRERRGGGWEDLGLVFGPNVPAYVRDGDAVGATTDASVVYADGRYHLVFGWCDPANKRGGLGYAWAPHPEGPYTCADGPLHDDRLRRPVVDRYVRAYASTLIRRRRDWLILHMMSTPGNAGGTWGLFAMTSREASGPYGEPAPLLLPQSGVFHPPLAECFPAFVHRGRVYAPATSVAANRSYQSLFAAALEEAHRPEAWRVERLGSLWHTEPVPWEARGIWGQTFAGAVTPKGMLRAMFPCKMDGDVGTISMASRPMSRPIKDGFVLAGPNGRAYAILRRTYERFTLAAQVDALGDWRLAWACRGALGPDHHLADSRPHRCMSWDRMEWRVFGNSWTLVQVDEVGRERTHAEGRLDDSAPSLSAGHRSLAVRMQCADELTRIWLQGREVFARDHLPSCGRIEIAAEQGAHVRVSAFRVSGEECEHSETWLATEALAGAACRSGEWTETDTAHAGVGFVSAMPHARAKFNFEGRRCELYAPRGPSFGRARVSLDGAPAADVNYRAEHPVASDVVYAAEPGPGRHALVIECTDGVTPLAGLRVVR